MQFVQCALGAVLIASIGYVQPAAAPASRALNIVVREGDRAMNVLDSGTAAKPVVEIRDSNDLPVAGARVSFVLPRTGARAVFAGNRESMSVTTASDGRATAAEMRPIGTGKFEIEIRSEYKGQTATATMTQTNFASRSEAQAADRGGTESASFKIQILEGDDGVNIIDKKTAVKPVVRVVDRNNLPVAGVAVAITVLATRGPRVELPGEKASITVTTDATGRAEAAALTPRGGTGSFQIEIQANHQGQTIKRAISQMNYPTEVAALRAGKIPGASKGDATSAGDPGVESIEITVANGGDGVNIVQDKTGVKPVVEVRNSSGLPVSGVQVAFVLPTRGARATFPDAKSYLIATTDANGRAEALQLLPLNNGAFNITVLAAYHGLVASTAIRQTNFPTRAAAQKATQPSSNTGQVAKKASTGASTGKLLLGGLLVAGSAAGIACAATEDKCQGNQSGGTSGPSCNASALRTQLQSQLQTHLAFCGGSSSGNTSSIYTAWDQLCKCVGQTTSDEQKALTLLNMCLRYLGVGFGDTPATVAANACR